MTHITKDLASNENWTHDPWFTRPVLCHWAIEAECIPKWRPSALLADRANPFKYLIANSTVDTHNKRYCLQWELNSRPLVYKTSALPLSYRGWMYTKGWPSALLANRANPFKYLIANNTADTHDKSNCLQWGLNSRPLVYKTSALPLSYRGWMYTKVSIITILSKSC